MTCESFCPSICVIVFQLLDATSTEGRRRRRFENETRRSDSKLTSRSSFFLLPSPFVFRSQYRRCRSSGSLRSSRRVTPDAESVVGGGGDVALLRATRLIVPSHPLVSDYIRGSARDTVPSVPKGAKTDLGSIELSSPPFADASREDRS